MNLNKFFTAIFLCLIGYFVNAQNIYKGESERVFDLIHTKLNLKFDIPESKVVGEAWITVKPHVYNSSKIILDAKGLKVNSVSVNNTLSKFKTTDTKLEIDFTHEFTKQDEIIIYIDYVAQPHLYREVNSDVQGLFFVNPRGEESNKPMQIWSQGEPESNSTWFPTLDSPNQKTSQEIFLTVPNKYKTLSNGLLISEKTNTDGTRTDYWMQELKHAPYLVFIGIGEFAVIKDSWKGKEISYYVEPEYKDIARDIFGLTSEMLTFYEGVFGVDYVWDKYSQIVVRDYDAFGAMENTGAVIHADRAYQDKGQLVDENIWEHVVAHEIAHHWFGNLVTTESWSNVSLNESFANYAEYLWFEHKYGRDYADNFLLKEREDYFLSNKETQSLVRFDYSDPQDVFDAVSYNKGGAILHQLRQYLGDEVFFSSIKKYLNKYKFSKAEVHQLRVVFEEVSGKDLNWYFNQWYYSSGYPKLEVVNEVTAFDNEVKITINQTSKLFDLPMQLVIYESSGKKVTHDLLISANQNSFSFKTNSAPKLVVVDPGKYTLAKINFSKSLDQYIYQFNHATHFIDRKIALEEIVKHQENKSAYLTVEKALKDKSEVLRIIALENIDLSYRYAKKTAITTVENIARNDNNNLVKAEAIMLLAKLIDPKYKPIFSKAVADVSYSVIESGVVGLYQLDKESTLVLVDALPSTVKDNLSGVLIEYFLENREDKYITYISKHLVNGLFFKQTSQSKTAQYQDAFVWVSQSDNTEAIQNLVDSFVAVGSKYKKQGGDKASISLMRQMVEIQKKSTNSNRDALILIIRKGIYALND